MANSKLLLIEDVEDLGRSGDVVAVRPGYARNYLLPKKLAVLATGAALKRQAKLQEERKQKALADKREAEEVAQKIVDLTVETHVKVDHDGHMYGSVSNADIAALIQAQHGIAIEKKSIQLKHPIKEVGVFDLVVKLKEGVTSRITIKVIPEETSISKTL